MYFNLFTSPAIVLMFGLENISWSGFLMVAGILFLAWNIGVVIHYKTAQKSVTKNEKKEKFSSAETADSALMEENLEDETIGYTEDSDEYLLTSQDDNSLVGVDEEVEKNPQINEQPEQVHQREEIKITDIEEEPTYKDYDPTAELEESISAEINDPAVFSEELEQELSVDKFISSYVHEVVSINDISSSEKELLQLQESAIDSINSILAQESLSTLNTLDVDPTSFNESVEMLEIEENNIDDYLINDVSDDNEPKI